ncbi:MAG: hypothetical protein R6X16_15535 [Anaerolineae bacterium]
MYRRLLSVLALVMTLSIVSCAQDVQPGAGTATPDRSPTITRTPAPVVTATRPIAEAQVTGEAYVTGATLSAPARDGGPYVLNVEGDLPDGCTTIVQVTQTRTAAGLDVVLVTTRPRDAFCTEALVPFEREIALETAGMPDGKYTVAVGGIELPLVLGAHKTPVGPASGAVGNLLLRDAVVEDVQVTLRGSDPVQVSVTVTGYYSDGCTTFHGTTQSVVGTRITLTVTTERPRDAMCTQAIVPYSETVEVDTDGIAPGTYTLDVNGIEQEIKLP